MALIDSKTVRVISTVLLFAAVLAFAWAAHKTLIAFLFAIFFAYLIDPLVEEVSKRLHISRGKSIGIVYAAIFLGLAILFLFVGPNIVHEGEKLSQTLPALYEKISTGQIAFQIGAQHGWSYETRVKIQHFLASHRETILSIAQTFGARLARLGSNAWLVVLIPILAVFFLKDGRKFGENVLDFFERRRQRQFADEVMTDIHIMLAHFIRAQLLLAAIGMGVYVAFLTLMRVPYGYVLGVIAGMLEFIPVVGPLIAAVLIVGVALGSGYGHTLIILLFLGVFRVVQDYVISPRIMGHSVELHPLASIFGILVGGEIGGIVGVYLSIPIMATLRILWRRWRAYNAGPTLQHPGDLVTIPDNLHRDRSA